MLLSLLLSSQIADAANVLIIYDSLSSNTTSLQSFLNSNGHTADLSSTVESQYNGSNPSLSSYDVVLHFNGDSYSSPMPSGGQSALVNFVNAGGGYIGTEWLSYEESSHTTMLDLILLDRSSGSTNQTTWTVASGQASHPVLQYISGSSVTDEQPIIS